MLAAQCGGERLASRTRASAAAWPSAPKSQGETTMGALSGLTVIDFSHYLAGPLATLWLAECGAEVIRIDPPGGPKYRHSANAILQRSKKSILLDLHDDAT